MGCESRNLATDAASACCSTFCTKGSVFLRRYLYRHLISYTLAQGDMCRLVRASPLSDLHTPKHRSIEAPIRPEVGSISRPRPSRTGSRPCMTWNSTRVLTTPSCCKPNWIPGDAPARERCASAFGMHPNTKAS
ncbi:rh135 [macacine betaherpesvirus 3]|uniref:Rh135 n=1 Tax=Rhesus cytomegalovirus (strain 68-1) TaxID=47929 RepID=Q7TFK5_RHCM6|nr:rh135 [macacine betaherpesvirus 3]AAP50659.1 rh135 [macacine betaherpesvirus 3]AAZ80641.1 rh135 [macacine betaherpesvirus 3]